MQSGRRPARTTTSSFGTSWSGPCSAATSAQAPTTSTPTASRGLPQPWAPIDVRPWRWPGPDHRLWVRDGVLAWTVVNDSPDAVANESSYYSIFIGARPNDELIVLDDLGIERDWTSREDL